MIGLPRGQKRSSETGVEDIDPEVMHVDTDIVVNIYHEPAASSGDGGPGAHAAAAPSGADDEGDVPMVELSKVKLELVRAVSQQIQLSIGNAATAK